MEASVQSASPVATRLIGDVMLIAARQKQPKPHHSKTSWVLLIRASLIKPDQVCSGCECCIHLDRLNWKHSNWHRFENNRAARHHVDLNVA